MESTRTVPTWLTCGPDSITIHPQRYTDPLCRVDVTAPGATKGQT